MNAVLHKKLFQNLTIEELYQLLRVRSEVFVVEQNCVYQDLDCDDQASVHLWLTVEDRIVAMARVCPAHTHMEEVSIGRVITTERGKGYGKQIMLSAIEAAIVHFDATVIDIEAQEYAKGFYEKVGFRQSTASFMLDGISHVGMRWERATADLKVEDASQLSLVELEYASPHDLECLDCLMQQLSTTSHCTRGNLDAVMRDANAHLYVIRNQGDIIAAATLCVAHTPEFKIGFIEAVVVLSCYRGKHLGKRIMQHLITEARSMGLQSLHLTSNPKREAANALYQHLGFQSYQTNVYRLDLQ